MDYSHDHRVTGITSVTTLVALGIASGVCAEEADPEIPRHPLMSDRFFIGAGLLWSDSDVTANLNTGRVGLGTFIDFEDDLGLEESNAVGLLMFRMRLSKRWRLEAEYLRLDRDNEKQLTRTIEWGNLNVPVTGMVDGAFNVEDARVSIAYSFFNRPDKEIGVGLGVHITSLEASLATRNAGSQRANTTAPLPALTLYARMALTDRWLLNIRVDRLSLDTGSVDGNIFSSGTEFVYQPWRHFNLGLGYRDINMQVSSTDDDWRGKAQVRLSGPFVFFSSTF